jgi:hypothetical protein
MRGWGERTLLQASHELRVSMMLFFVIAAIWLAGWLVLEGARHLRRS